MAAILELGAQLAKIIDLAVIGEHDRLVVARHRLGATLDIDDREAEVPKTHPRCGPLARTVGPTMRHRMQHGANARRIDGLCRLQMINARDPTHVRIA